MPTKSTQHWLSLTVLFLTLAAATGAARAQETPPPAAVTPAPSASDRPTAMDREYDGRVHFTVAPYIWAPTVKANVQYSIPKLPRHPVGGGIAQSSVQAGPSDYVPKINSALMLAFEARKGEADLFGDVIYLNASTSASFAGTVTGPLGKVRIPYSIDTDAHMSSAIWEAAAGFTIARGHNADLNFFAGVRQVPFNLTLGYNAVIGKRGIIAPSGSISTSDHTSDAIFGLRGKAFFGDDHWVIPYYADIGTGINNQSWQAYGGAGYVFDHGQSIVAAYRTLNYNAFPATAHVQKFSLGGPLLSYTFQL